MESTDRTGPSRKTISPSGLDFIKGWEKLELESYPDEGGVWTIGYGTTVLPCGTPVSENMVCTEDEAEVFFQHDISVFESAINNYVKVELNQNQFDALVSFVYNIGISGFKTSSALKRLNLQDFKAVPERMKLWNKVKGKVSRGLVRRRAAEAKLFLLPEKPENDI